MSHQPLLFLHLLLFFISFFFLFMKSNANNTTSLSAYCYTSKCGDFEVKYPFWLRSNSTANQYCGYQGFGLDCLPSSNFSNLILHLPTDDFFVKNINHPEHTITLVDIDATTNLTCPRARQNLTLEELPLDYSIQDLNLTFYFNCTGPLPSIASANAVDCLRSGENMSYVSLETNVTFDWFDVCEEKVVATVIEREIKGMNSIWASMFSRAMNDGFVLDWHSGIDCEKCELSHGHCGYNNVTEEFLCFCNDGTIKFDECKGRQKKKVIIVATATSVIVFAILVILAYCFRRKLSFFGIWSKTDKFKNVEDLLMNYGSFAPKRYHYSQVKKMTNSFNTKLGQGGYGCVYKGKLQDGSPVAVKVLKEMNGSGEEFLNEVASISRTSHINIVTLLGFCFQGHKRALVYEFMPNGSLEKFIYGGNSLTKRQLGWPILYKIAVGIARGLEYLHRGCNTRILHFDIKPHNILLDESFCPKISDFGLAKICPQKESIVSIGGTRGTVGYIAPEVSCKSIGGVSHKSDVYSYGMMVLEMVGGRKNIDVGVDRTSEIYFPEWIYKRLDQGEELGLYGIFNEEENEIARKMIIVSLWCIQIDPLNRPSMSKVVEMLEGNLQNLETPPKPFMSSSSGA